MPTLAITVIFWYRSRKTDARDHRGSSLARAHARDDENL
jgi:hypothetical protein